MTLRRRSMRARAQTCIHMEWNVSTLVLMYKQSFRDIRGKCPRFVYAINYALREKDKEASMKFSQTPFMRDAASGFKVAERRHVRMHAYWHL